MTNLTAASIAIAAVSILALARGLRGRVREHTAGCARCRFSLDGLAPAVRCPECGADLTRDEARRVPVRVRSRKLITLGAAGLLVAILLGLESRLALVQSIQWIRFAPLSLIEQNATSDNIDVGNSAFYELMRRADAGQVPPDRVGRVVRSLLTPSPSERAQNLAVRLVPYAQLDDVRFMERWALDRLADPDAYLSPEMSHVLDREFCVSTTRTPDELTSYLRSAVRPALTLFGPPTAAPGEPLKILFQWNARTWMPVGARLEIPGAAPLGSASAIPADWAGSLSDQMDLVYTIPATTEPGEHEIRGVARISLTGPAFTALASSPGLWSQRFGGVASIPPLTIEYPIAVKYRIDPAITFDEQTRAVRRSVAMVPDRSWSAALRIVFAPDLTAPEALCAITTSDNPTPVPLRMHIDPPRIRISVEPRQPVHFLALGDHVCADVFYTQKLPVGSTVTFRIFGDPPADGGQAPVLAEFTAPAPPPR